MADTKPSTTTIPYLAGLDGLRALAVLAVLLYHADVTWMRGGFLGVDVFFVISGYLITLLLTAERQRTGRIRIGHFYRRRARRLLPALYALLLVVTAVSVVWVREDLSKLRGQLLAALTYCTNWYLIATKTSYFDHLGRPPLLQHLWSLAVEEQFYLVWPVLLIVLWWVLRGRTERIAAVIGAMALASTIWMAVLYNNTDPSRAYYGTDTRAAPLLLGALLALFWRPAHLARGPVADQGRRVDLVGCGGLAVLLVFARYASDTGPFLYYGGFLLAAVATMGAVAAAAHPHSTLGAMLGTPPMRWIGQRSYGLYLWHWPVFCLTRPGIDVPWTPGQTLLARFALTFGLSELCYRWVEQPIRRGAPGRWWATLRTAPPVQREHRLRLAGWSAAVTTLVVSGLVVAVVTAQPHENAIAKSIEAGSAALAAQPPSPTTAVPASSAPPTQAPTAAPTSAGARTTPAATTAAPTTAATTTAAPATSTTAAPATTAAPPRPIHAIAIGDSVMLGAAAQLKAVLGSDSYIDAKVGRQFKEAIGIVDAFRTNGQLGSVVIVHLGNNGSVSGATVEALLDDLKDVKEVVLVNVRVSQPWESSVNATLASRGSGHANVRLVDWLDTSAAYLDEFYSDGTHLKPPGARLYASAIAGVIQG